MQPAKFEEITEDAIRILVDAFHAKLRRDPHLGPIFERAIGPDWSAHLRTMYRFWSSALCAGGRSSKGDSPAMHQRLPGREPTLIDRWLELFDETADARFVEDLAARFKTIARGVPEQLVLGLFYRPGQPIARPSPDPRSPGAR